MGLKTAFQSFDFVLGPVVLGPAPLLTCSKGAPLGFEPLVAKRCITHIVSALMFGPLSVL